MRVWEHEFKTDYNKVIDEIESFIVEHKNEEVTLINHAHKHKK